MQEHVRARGARRRTCAFILAAVCQVRHGTCETCPVSTGRRTRRVQSVQEGGEGGGGTSPMRPIACESDDMIEIAPMSCRHRAPAPLSRAREPLSAGKSTGREGAAEGRQGSSFLTQAEGEGAGVPAECPPP